jgi:hypothetical protein
LKKKTKTDSGLSKKGKKSSKKSDTAAANVDDNDDDIYPAVKVTRGGELPEGLTESGNEDNDHDTPVGKNKKLDPHRALNIDLDEKPIQPIPTPPQISLPKPVETLPVSTEKPKKSKKKKTIEKNESLPTTKPKHKRERNDYKELVSPPNDEEKHVVSSTTTEEKPKKKKSKEKKSAPKATDTNNSVPHLFDIMGDDVNPTNQSNQQYDEQDPYKLAAQSGNLTIVSKTRVSQFCCSLSHYEYFF